jgi:hypothetical protein
MAAAVSSRWRAAYIAIALLFVFTVILYTTPTFGGVSMRLSWSPPSGSYGRLYLG